MAHTARAHVPCLSAMIMVAITTSCLTWLLVSKERKLFVQILNGTSVADMFRAPCSPASCFFQVREDSFEDKRLAWYNKWDYKNFTLDESNMWIKVKEQGVYLVYIQLTYSLKKDDNSTSVDLTLNVEFNYNESREEFAGAFDTRELREKEEDAHLSTFILLPMEAGNSLSILATPKKRIKYNDVRPVSSFISIIRYADYEP